MQNLRSAARRVWAFISAYWVIALFVAIAVAVLVLGLLASGSN